MKAMLWVLYFLQVLAAVVMLVVAAEAVNEKDNLMLLVGILASTVNFLAANSTYHDARNHEK